MGKSNTSRSKRKQQREKINQNNNENNSDYFYLGATTGVATGETNMPYELLDTVIYVPATGTYGLGSNVNIRIRESLVEQYARKADEPIRESVRKVTWK